MSTRCDAPGCGRFTRRDQLFCARHQNTDDLIGRASTGEQADAGSLFLERLGRGDYQDLLEPEIWQAIEQAGAEQGLTTEIGVLRLVLARLLSEEQDPARLASSAARVSGALVQAARAQQTLRGDAANGLVDAVTRVLLELNGGT